MKKIVRNYRRKSLLGVMSAVGIFAVLVAAGANAATAPTDVISDTGDIVDLFCGALKWMFWGLIVLSVMMFIVGGYIYATSEGDSEKVGKATKTLTYAAIGVVVALVALGAPQIIGSFFSVSGLNACSL